MVGSLPGSPHPGKWVVDALIRLDDLDDAEVGVVVSARTKEQIAALRGELGCSVAHLHLRASDATLAARCAIRGSTVEITEMASYGDLKRNATERKVSRLEDDADIVIDSDRNTPRDILVRAATRLLEVSTGAKERDRAQPT
jgi:hypothetical protein